MQLYTYMPPDEALPRPLGHLPDLEAISWAIRPSGCLPGTTRTPGHLPGAERPPDPIFLGHNAISVGHKAISLGHKAFSQSHQVFSRRHRVFRYNQVIVGPHWMLTKPPDGIPNALHIQFAELCGGFLCQCCKRVRKQHGDGPLYI